MGAVPIGSTLVMGILDRILRAGEGKKLKALAGHRVRMQGFMAPPLKAEAKFFVLTERPMALCPFCSSDADWPPDIVVVYLDRAQTFEQANARIDQEGDAGAGSKPMKCVEHGFPPSGG